MYQPFVLAEPIGGATPKFISDSKHLGTFVKSEGGNLALLCPAQAMPLPTFRFGFIAYLQMVVRFIKSSYIWLWTTLELMGSCLGSIPAFQEVFGGIVFF